MTKKRGFEHLNPINEIEFDFKRTVLNFQEEVVSTKKWRKNRGFEHLNPINEIEFDFKSNVNIDVKRALIDIIDCRLALNSQ